MNSLNEELQQFVSTLDQYDWFCDVEFDRYNRLVVYVYEFDINFIGSVPQMIGGYHVLFHYAASQSNQYSVSKPVVPVVPAAIVIKEDSSVEESESVDLEFLISELDRLEKICGRNILQDIFYEVHDGKNAVTNLSARFPEVKESLDVLYEEFGFNLIYEELDG
jgi:hypothetical protein